MVHSIRSGRKYRLIPYLAVSFFLSLRTNMGGAGFRRHVPPTNFAGWATVQMAVPITDLHV